MWGDIAIAFLLAFITAYVITPYTIRLAKKIGALDIPKDKRKNVNPTQTIANIKEKTKEVKEELNETKDIYHFLTLKDMRVIYRGKEIGKIVDIENNTRQDLINEIYDATIVDL